VKVTTWVSIGGTTVADAVEADPPFGVVAVVDTRMPVASARPDAAMAVAVLRRVMARRIASFGTGQGGPVP
jgi:hypothetical protein